MGNVESIWLMSLENLLRILPTKQEKAKSVGKTTEFLAGGPLVC